jgi:hypothetical protein
MFVFKKLRYSFIFLFIISESLKSIGESFNSVKIRLADNSILSWSSETLYPQNLGMAVRLIIKTDQNPNKFAEKIAKIITAENNKEFFKEFSIHPNDDNSISLILLGKSDVSIWARGVKSKSITLHLVNQKAVAKFSRVVTI